VNYFCREIRLYPYSYEFHSVAIRNNHCRRDGLIGASMKKILSALILVTLAAAPALAKQRYLVSDRAAAAQAYVPYNQSWHGLDRYTVVSGGRIVGRDPDPNVRQMLMRDNVTNLP
jgi:hypothetical protein